MSLKMNIEIAVHISRIVLHQLQRVGWIQYRISLAYLPKDIELPIFFMASNISFQPKTIPKWTQPFIHHHSFYCYSSKFQTQYTNQPFHDQTTYFFKSYIDLILLQKMQLIINVDLLFSQQHASNFKVIHSYQGNIKKTHGVFTYLPICFDKLRVLRLQGIYHSALMELKFQKSEQDSHLLKKSYKSLEDYIQSLTQGYKMNELMNFCKYYRQTMENQFEILQERYNKILKTKDLQSHKLKFIKLNRHKKLQQLLHEMPNNKYNLAMNQREQLIELILQDILCIKALIYQQWNNINLFVVQNSSLVTEKYKERYQYQFKERLKANIFSSRIKNHDWTFSKYNDKKHQQHSEIVRKKSQAQIQLWDETFLIEGQNQFEKQSKSIKIFQEIYQTGNIIPSQNVPQQCQHVIILVHGFQAHRNDFLQLKQCLQARHKAKVYISISNMGKTQESINNCGQRLAIEINNLTKVLNKNFKVSFIAHSMGGIIVRCALRYLQNLKEHFHAYVSICTPHLGYLYSTSKLVHAGLWLINTLQKCDSILELCMQDNKNRRECLLYKLAEQGLLNNFNKLAFIASSQDEYVAYESARVQKSAKILAFDLKNTQESSIICQMIDNMLCQVPAYEIARLDSNLDSFLGRTGHIKFLNDPHFIKQFVVNLAHLFL